MTVLALALAKEANLLASRVAGEGLPQDISAISLPLTSALGEDFFARKGDAAPPPLGKVVAASYKAEALVVEIESGLTREHAVVRLDRSLGLLDARRGRAEPATTRTQETKVGKRHNAPLLMQAPAAGWTVSTVVGGSTSEFPVHVSAEQRKLVQSGRDRQWSSTVYAFAIASEGTNRFEWSCWAPSFPLPHNFGLFRSAKGKTYAGLVGDGIRLFEVSVARPGDRMQENYLARKPHPDELPTLSVSTMLPVMGTGIISSRKFDLVIDRVDETPEGLTVAVRSSATTTRFTFLLQNGQWRLLRD